MTMISIPRDTALDRAMVFAKNHRPDGGLSNLYTIKLINSDENIIDEKYGMNLFTDYGMQQFFVENENFPTKLYVGNTVDARYTTMNSADHAIYQPIPDLTDASYRSGSPNYDYPLYFAPEYGDGSQGGLITCIMKYGTFRLTDMLSKPDTIITEYGIGSAIDELWTHSWIYASDGTKTSISTHEASTIEIDAYFCFSYFENQIINGRTNGVYTMITNMKRFMNRMDVDGVYTYKKNNSVTGRSISKVSSAVMNNRYSVTHNLSQSFTLTNTNFAESYIDGFVQRHDGFVIVTPESRTVAETVETPSMMNGAGNIESSKSLSNNFGENTTLPFTRITISDVVAFDVNTNTWAASLRYKASPNHDYCETPLQPELCAPLWYTSGGSMYKLYVYQNIHTDDPILSIETTASTVYAATKYWDKSTWTLITDHTNIPIALRTCPYLISSSNSSNSIIRTNRESGTFYLKPHAGSGDSDGYFSINETSFPVASYKQYGYVSNATYNWFAYGDKVYVVDDNNPYTFSVGSDIPNFYFSSTYGFGHDWFTYGKWAIFVYEGGFLSNKLRIYDMTNAVSYSPNGPTPTDMTVGFTSVSNIYSTYITESKTGLFCFSDSSTDEAVIVDLRGSTIPSSNTKLTNTHKAACIGGTTNIAYFDNSTGTLKIMNIDTSQISEISLPASYGTPTFIGGTDNYVWVSNNSSTIVINTSTRTTTECDMVFNGSSTLTRVKTYDDVVLVYQENNANAGGCGFVTSTSNPSHLTDLLSIISENGSSQVGGRNEYRFNIDIIDTRYTVNNTDYRVLTLISTRYYRWDGLVANRQISNIGLYLFDNTKNDITQASSTGFSALIPYGDYVISKNTKFIPVENIMDIKIRGTTPTLTSLNKIKSVDSKSWTVDVTNIATFGTGDYDGRIPGSSN